MDGLRLDRLLRLLDADPMTVAALAFLIGFAGLLIWAASGSRKLLRKCLVLSIVAHFGIVCFGSTDLVGWMNRSIEPRLEPNVPGIKTIEVVTGNPSNEDSTRGSSENADPGSVPFWDRLDTQSTTLPESPAAEFPDRSFSLEPNLARPFVPSDREPVRLDSGTRSIEPSTLTSLNVPTPEFQEHGGPFDPLAGIEPVEVDDSLFPPPRESLVDEGGESQLAMAFPEPRSLDQPPPLPITRPTPRRLQLGTGENETAGLQHSLPEPPTRSDLSLPQERLTPAPEPIDLVEATLSSANPLESIPSPDPGQPDPVMPDLSVTNRIGREPEFSELPLPSRRRSTVPIELPTPEPSSVDSGLILPEGRTLAQYDPGLEGLLEPVAPLTSQSPLPETVPTPITIEPESTVMEPVLPEPVLRISTSTPTAINLIPPQFQRATDNPSAALTRVVPDSLPDLNRIAPRESRRLDQVPIMSRRRYQPTRDERARRAGATDATEEAVGLALEWLAIHQNDDGRWDGGAAKQRDGTPIIGQQSFLAHCPPGDPCRGECYYWEADTAMTALALLAYLGARQTHQEGAYQSVVHRGLEFLLREQLSNGDLRGGSRSIGMYCHTMATLALVEAYAITRDERLLAPACLAVQFLDQAQYPRAQGWRYTPAAEISRTRAQRSQDPIYRPHPPIGDTSILGWVVLVLKTAEESGIQIPVETKRAAAQWLDQVSTGSSGGLAVYQPSLRYDSRRNRDPVMTAEALVCRQFLGVTRRSATNEATALLLQHLPGTEEFNIYYWYYATIAMYREGGPAWEQWNAALRKELLKLQRRDGHARGSWGPDRTRYGRLGGRIYTTALATLSLEVYYRYLRVNDK